MTASHKDPLPPLAERVEAARDHASRKRVEAGLDPTDPSEAEYERLRAEAKAKKKAKSRA